MTLNDDATGRMTVLAFYSWPSFWSMGEGSGAAPFFLSVTSFPKHGHEMHVLMPGPRGCPREESYHGVVLHRFRTAVDFMPELGRSKVIQHLRLFFSYIYWFMRTVPAGLVLASRVRPQVVIGMGALAAPVAFLVARVKRIPNVTRLFGTALSQVIGKRFRYMLRYWEIAAFRTPADFIIVCDDGSGGDEVARMLGVDMDRFIYWPDGIDKSGRSTEGARASVKREFGVPEGHKVVLSVSRLHAEKHVDRLLRAVPEVLSNRDDVTFLVVGSGEESENLRALAEELGVRGSVIFTGALPVKRIPDICRASDLFVTLSDRTNVCNPLHEAMIAGLPVISLNTGRTRDVVENGKTGVLLQIEELGRLPGVILEFLADDDRRRSLGEGARRSADERLPTIEERQAMEVGVAERAIREHRRRHRPTSTER